MAIMNYHSNISPPRQRSSRNPNPPAFFARRMSQGSLGSCRFCGPGCRVLPPSRTLGGAMVSGGTGKSTINEISGDWRLEKSITR